jgi:hypothetical protein
LVKGLPVVLPAEAERDGGLGPDLKPCLKLGPDGFLKPPLNAGLPGLKFWPGVPPSGRFVGEGPAPSRPGAKRDPVGDEERGLKLGFDPGLNPAERGFPANGRSLRAGALPRFGAPLRWKGGRAPAGLASRERNEGRPGALSFHGWRNSAPGLEPPACRSAPADGRAPRSKPPDLKPGRAPVPSAEEERRLKSPGLRALKSLKSPRGLNPPVVGFGKRPASGRGRNSLRGLNVARSPSVGEAERGGAPGARSRGQRAFSPRAAGDLAKPGLPLSFQGGRAGVRSRRGAPAEAAKLRPAAGLWGRSVLGRAGRDAAGRGAVLGPSVLRVSGRGRAKIRRLRGVECSRGAASVDAGCCSVLAASAAGFSSCGTFSAGVAGRGQTEIVSGSLGLALRMEIDSGRGWAGLVAASDEAAAKGRRGARRAAASVVPVVAFSAGEAVVTSKSGREPSTWRRVSRSIGSMAS